MVHLIEPSIGMLETEKDGCITLLAKTLQWRCYREDGETLTEPMLAR
jgi:hypothetical protein